ncbi:hypothetical protein FXB39_00920 [Nocardioides sp. BGMRC 2183]|nr:hypothetical protein FXB39_00920 [Nocardioides sp. BGMRC 2183]
MHLTDLLDEPFLPPSFPLPLDRPFTRAMARAEGVAGQDLTWLVRNGFVRRALHNVYVASHLPDTLGLRCDCLRLVVPEDAVVCDGHAGWLAGATMTLAPGEHLELRPVSVFLPPGRRLRNGLCDSGERRLTPGDVTEIDGIQVTTPLRTAWDLGRSRWPDRAIAGIDQMLRLGRFERQQLVEGVRRFRGMRWVTTLRAVAPLADGRAESPPESVLRLRWLEARLPAPTPQVEVWHDGRFLARLDLANEDLRFAVEYDGEEWHGSPEQLEHDRVRRELVRDLADWHVLAVGKKELFGHTQSIDKVLRDGVTEARRRRG